MRDARRWCCVGVHFVPAHPLAGTEYSGLDARFTSLFVNRWDFAHAARGIA